MYGDAGEVGGHAHVHYLGNLATADFTDYAAELFSDTTVTHSTEVFVAHAEGCYTVESYSANGRQIRFCGHGALAAAFVVFEELESDAEIVHFANHYQRWQAHRSAGGVVTMVYSCPVVVDCPVPEFAELVLGVQPIAAAASGGDAGYLLLVVADAATLQKLRPDLQHLVASTDCALIVTALDAQASVCCFRYFAPQYGTPEDAATGSAAVQLAAFWQPRVEADELQLQQLSAGGALLSAACRGDHVELSARVGYC